MRMLQSKAALIGLRFMAKLGSRIRHDFRSACVGLTSIGYCMDSRMLQSLYGGEIHLRKRDRVVKNSDDFKNRNLYHEDS